MSKAVIWCRVSTDAQEFYTQQEDLIRTAIREGYKEEDLIIIGEAGASAISMNDLYKKEVNQLIETIKSQNDINTVYVWEVSRLARNELAFYSMKSVLVEEHIQLVCKVPSIRLLDEDGNINKGAELSLNLLVTLAKQEMEIKSKRLSRGKRRLAEQGKYNGGAIPYGYKVDYDKDKLIVIDEAEAAVVRDIFNMYENGYSQMKIAKELYHRGIKGRAVRKTKNFTISLVNQILNNELLTGKPNLNKGSSFVRIYPSIISKAQFERCRKIAKENNTTLSKSPRIYYATSLIKCTECGKFFGAQGQKSNYHCRDAYNGNRQYEGYDRPQCSNRIMIGNNIMDSLLWELTIDYESMFIMDSASEKLEECEKNISILQEKINAIPSKFDELEKRRGYLLDALAEGMAKERYLIKKDALNKEKSEIEADLVAFKEQLAHYQNLKEELNGNLAFKRLSTDAEIDKFVEMADVVRENVKAINDDEERKRLIHKHIKEVRVEWSKMLYKFNRYPKQTETKVKRISVDFYLGHTRFFCFIPFNGKGGIMLEEKKKCPSLSIDLPSGTYSFIPGNNKYSFIPDNYSR